MQCELEAGPCVDLNLIAAKSLRAVHARVHRLQEPLAVPAGGGGTTLIFPIDAAVAVRCRAAAMSPASNPGIWASVREEPR